MKFQKICLLSAESHKLDGWMVRFLLDHSVEIEDRYSAPGSTLRNMENDQESPRTKELREAGRYTDFDTF